LQVAIFALGPTHDPYDEREWRDSWSQLNKELEKYSWLNPVEIEMFGGKYDPTKLKFPLKMMADVPNAMDLQVGTNISITLSGDNEEELTRYFNMLSAG